jgi:hypothetical protein
MSQPKKPYAVERHFVDDVVFIEIQFWDDDGKHRVWPYIGISGFSQYKGHQFFGEDKQKFQISGSFDTQAEARDAALSAGLLILDEDGDIAYEVERHRISPELDKFDLRNGL